MLYHRIQFYCILHEHACLSAFFLSRRRDFSRAEYVALSSDVDLEEGSTVRIYPEPRDSIYFLTRASFVPLDNPYDEFYVFGPTSQLVQYFLDNFIEPRDLGFDSESGRGGGNATEGTGGGGGRWGRGRGEGGRGGGGARSREGLGRGVGEGGSKGNSQGAPKILPGMPLNLNVAKEQFKERAGAAVDVAASLILAATRGDPGQPYYFGAHGYLDSRLWAAYAVCTFYKSHSRPHPRPLLPVPPGGAGRKLLGSFGGAPGKLPGSSPRLNVAVLARLAHELAQGRGVLGCDGLSDFARKGVPSRERGGD